MTASDFYEVRCPSCRTSFPPETKRCIHCGGPLGAGGGAVVDAESDEDVPFRSGRSIVWVVTAVIALVLSMLRNCQGS